MRIKKSHNRTEFHPRGGRAHHRSLQDQGLLQPELPETFRGKELQAGLREGRHFEE